MSEDSQKHIDFAPSGNEYEAWRLSDGTLHRIGLAARIHPDFAKEWFYYDQLYLVAAPESGGWKACIPQHSWTSHVLDMVKDTRFEPRKSKDWGEDYEPALWEFFVDQESELDELSQIIIDYVCSHDLIRKHHQTSMLREEPI